MRHSLMSIVAAGLLSFAAGSATHAEVTGYFHTEKRDGRWWLITPKGDLFVSKGVCSVRYAPDKVRGTGPSLYGEANAKKYASPEAWGKAKTEQLLDWDFNTLGAWYDDDMVHQAVNGRSLARTPILNIAADFARKQIGTSGEKKSAWELGVFPDVFGYDFEAFARERARKICAPQATDPNILGWFIDNELRWGPDWRSQDELLVTFLNGPRDSAGRKEAIKLLQARYGSIAALNEVWNTGAGSWEELSAAKEIRTPFPHQEKAKQNQEIIREGDANHGRRKQYVADCDAFLGLLAERYFAVTAQAVREAAPHHLIFGCRFAYMPARSVIEAAATACRRDFL